MRTDLLAQKIFLVKLGRIRHNTKYTVTIWGFARDLKDEFWIGWLDLLTPYTRNSELQVLQRCLWSTHFTIHRYKRTRVLSLH
jgi:hypothetical protein